MKNSQKGFAPIILMVIVIVVLVGGYYVYSQRTDQSNENEQVSTDTIANTYENTNAGFKLIYPSKWEVDTCETLTLKDANCVLALNAGKPNSFNIPNTVEVFVGTTSTTFSSSVVEEKIQSIISSDYTTPTESYGAETNYRAESDRYSIKPIQTISGVRVFNYSYLGKHTVNESYFYFETKKGMTAIIKSVSDDYLDIDNGDAFVQSEDFKALLDSIELID